MSLFSLFYRDKMRASEGSLSKNAVIDELDNLTTAVSGWALVEHNEDGSHKLIQNGYSFVPVGAQIRWPLTTAPSGWLLCNGAAINRAAFPLLFKTIGITSGAGDGLTTFNLPNVANFIILAA